LLTPEDVLHVPEFLLAYQRSNSGGVTNGIPKPKYRDADKTENPERYKKQQEEYLAALKKFIQARPETVAGMELDLDGVNPARKWAAAQNLHRSECSNWRLPKRRPNIWRPRQTRIWMGGDGSQPFRLEITG